MVILFKINLFLEGINNMKVLPTIEKAKREIQKLESYISLVENYNDDTLKEKILKAYAYTGSIEKTKLKINNINANENLSQIDSVFIKNIILSKPEDPLHKLLKSNYFLKTKGKRRRSKR